MRAFWATHLVLILINFENQLTLPPPEVSFFSLLRSLEAFLALSLKMKILKKVQIKHRIQINFSAQLYNLLIKIYLADWVATDFGLDLMILGDGGGVLSSTNLYKILKLSSSYRAKNKISGYYSIQYTGCFCYIYNKFKI